MKCGNFVCLNELDSYSEEKANGMNYYQFCKQCRNSLDPFVKQCTTCNDTFVTVRASARYCSIKCRRRGGYQKNKTKILAKSQVRRNATKGVIQCVMCNIILKTRQHKYCSAKCRKQAEYMRNKHKPYHEYKKPITTDWESVLEPLVIINEV